MQKWPSERDRCGASCETQRRPRRTQYIAKIAATLLATGVFGLSLSDGPNHLTHAEAAVYKQTQKNITVENQVFSRPYAFVASDGSTETTFMPIWYIGQALEKLGITQAWDGTSKTWILSIPGSTGVTGIPVGSGSARIVINGQTVKQLPTYVAKDPGAGPNAQATVYMPIYYVQQILQAAGIPSAWTGTTWKISTTLADASTAFTMKSSTSPLVFGFVTDSSVSLNDLKAHSGIQAFAMPTCSMTAAGSVSGQMNAAALQYANSNGLAAYLTINNYSSSLGNFDGKMTAAVLANPTTTAALINHIVSLVQNTSLSGVNIDFEMLPKSSQTNLVNFLATLQTRLHQVGQQLNVDVPGVTNSNSAYDYAAIGKSVDDVIVMAYDYSYPGGPAGAIAPLWWVKQVVTYAVKSVPANQIVLGIPMYGYDWHSGSTTALSLPAVDKQLVDFHITPSWDSTDDAPYFTYTSGSTTHTVYYENAQSLTDKLNIARQYGLLGVSLWHMDLENQAAWNTVTTYVNTP